MTCGAVSSKYHSIIHLGKVKKRGFELTLAFASEYGGLRAIHAGSGEVWPLKYPILRIDTIGQLLP
jgi:hypothetical protein